MNKLLLLIGFLLILISSFTSSIIDNSTYNMTSDGGCTAWAFVPFNNTIFNDSFNRADSATVGNGWTESASNAFTITSNTLQGPGSGEIINRSFTAVRVDYWSFNAKITGGTSQNSANIRLYTGGTTGSQVMHIIFRNDGNIKYHDGAYQTIQAYTPGVNYFIEFKNIDFDTDTADIWIDGVEKIVGGGFSNAASTVDSIRIDNNNGYQLNLYDLMISTAINNGPITSATCNTTDGTPTVVFDTTGSDSCSLRDEAGNYNAGFICGTTGGTSHVCTIYDENKLVFGLNSLYASCSAGDTSDALSINMTAGSGGLSSCIKILGSPCAIDLTGDCSIIT